MIYYKKSKFINISIFKVACDRQTSSGLRDRLSDGRHPRLMAAYFRHGGRCLQRRLLTPQARRPRRRRLSLRAPIMNLDF